MKHHDGGVRGGHKFALKNPVRRQCSGCTKEFIGFHPQCNGCRKVIALPVRRDEDPEPPRAA